MDPLEALRTGRSQLHLLKQSSEAAPDADSNELARVPAARHDIIGWDASWRMAEARYSTCAATLPASLALLSWKPLHAIHLFCEMSADLAQQSEASVTGACNQSEGSFRIVPTSYGRPG